MNINAFLRSVKKQLCCLWSRTEPANVVATVIEELPTATAVPVADGDTIAMAIAKLQAQIDAL